MPQKLLEAAQHQLSFAQIQDPTDPFLEEFLNACKSNDAAVAIQLAPDRDAGALTFGFNEAVGENHLSLARQLLQGGAKWDSHTVHFASKSLDAVKMLVESGFDVNTGLIRGGVLLCLVVAHNNEACIRFVLEHGAKPNLGPPRYTQGPIFKVRPIPNSPCALNFAAAYCTPETFALLLSYGANISKAIPLHYAAGHGPSLYDSTSSGSRIPMLEYLVGLGLDVNAMDDAIKIADDGRGQVGTPLQYAVLWGRMEEAKWLLDRGADPDKKTPYGISARDRVKKFAAEDKLAILLRTA
ncbi:ankyrin repeat-containing domain protein [Phaeosphaeriaceae sp. PMI808]|nr:ankyrin repeat-containing domain protein [Phaeosphaeriaceae sp. PMI808]